jgi:nucleoside-diphosphate-sugar epimerase
VVSPSLEPLTQGSAKWAPDFRPYFQMRTFVTGHNGYNGSVLVQMLQEAGHDVVGRDSDLFAPCTFGPPTEEIESLGSVRDVDNEHQRHLVDGPVAARVARISAANLTSTTGSGRSRASPTDFSELTALPLTNARPAPR